MSLFVIGDLHLSLGDPEKSMEIFPGWENYQERIERNWLETVGEQDTIVLAGDISWGMSLAKAQHKNETERLYRVRASKRDH